MNGGGAPPMGGSVNRTANNTSLLTIVLVSRCILEWTMSHLRIRAKLGVVSLLSSRRKSYSY